MRWREGRARMRMAFIQGDEMRADGGGDGGDDRGAGEQIKVVGGDDADAEPLADDAAPAAGLVEAEVVGAGAAGGVEEKHIDGAAAGAVARENRVGPDIAEGLAEGTVVGPRGDGGGRGLRLTAEAQGSAEDRGDRETVAEG